MKTTRSTLATFAALAALLLVAPPGAGAHPGGHASPKQEPDVVARATSAGETITAKVRTVTMQGEIVDPQCWIQHDGRGKAHTGCALACAKAGQTLAFLDDKSGTLYQLLAENHSSNPNEKWYGFVGKPVIVKGDVMARGGMNAIILRTAVVDRAGKQRP